MVQSFFLIAVFVAVKPEGVVEPAVTCTSRTCVVDRRDINNFLNKPRSMMTNADLFRKLPIIKRRMKFVRNPQNNKEGRSFELGTKEDATEYLNRHINMACPPSACAEYDGMFFFSGGTSVNAIEDFSSGFSIAKNGDIFSWDKEECCAAHSGNCSADQPEIILPSINGMPLKTDMIDFQRYLNTIGFNAIEETLNQGGDPVLKIGLRDAAWLMWEKDIIFPSNDMDHAEWRRPVGLEVDQLKMHLRERDSTRYNLIKGETLIANCEVSAFDTCHEQMKEFLLRYAVRLCCSAPVKFSILNDLESSYIGPQTNMLYITERGSREDSLIYKNITLKVKYVDDSVLKYRKEIATSLMRDGAVLKSAHTNGLMPNGEGR